MINRYLLLIFFICTFSAISQQIKIYKWSGKDGTIHYSQFPPKVDIDSNQITMEQIPVSNSSEKKEENIKDWMEGIQKFIEEKENLRKIKATKAKMVKENNIKCTSANNKLKLYQSGRRIRKKDDDGKSFRVISESERDISIKRLKKDIKLFC